MSQVMKCWECNKEYNDNWHPKLCKSCSPKKHTITLKITTMGKDEKEALKRIKRKLNTLERNYIIGSYEIVDIKESA